MSVSSIIERIKNILYHLSVFVVLLIILFLYCILPIGIILVGTGVNKEIGIYFIFIGFGSFVVSCILYVFLKLIMKAISLCCCFNNELKIGIDESESSSDTGAQNLTSNRIVTEDPIEVTI